MVKTLKDAEDRIRRAMIPPTVQAGQDFAPGIQKMRQTAKSRPTKRQLPTAR